MNDDDRLKAIERHLVEWGWDADFREDVAWLVDEVKRLRAPAILGQALLDKVQRSSGYKLTQEQLPKLLEMIGHLS